MLIQLNRRYLWKIPGYFYKSMKVKRANNVLTLLGKLFGPQRLPGRFSRASGLPGPDFENPWCRRMAVDFGAGQVDLNPCSVTFFFGYYGPHFSYL